MVKNSRSAAIMDAYRRMIEERQAAPALERGFLGLFASGLREYLDNSGAFKIKIGNAERRFGTDNALYFTVVADFCFADSQNSYGILCEARKAADALYDMKIGDNQVSFSMDKDHAANAAAYEAVAQELIRAIRETPGAQVISL